MINPVMLQAYYTFILFIFSMFLWTFRHKHGAYPILSREMDYQMMCFLMHVCNITGMCDLREWGIRKNTLKAFYAKEIRNYKESHPGWVKRYVKRPVDPLKKEQLTERQRLLREDRIHRERQREEVNMMSWKKLDDAIRERYECGKSVLDFYLHRGEKHG